MAINGFSRKFGMFLLGIIVLLSYIGYGVFFQEALLYENTELALDFKSSMDTMAFLGIGAFLAIVRDLFTDKNEFTPDKVMEIITQMNNGGQAKIPSPPIGG